MRTALALFAAIAIALDVKCSHGHLGQLVALLEDYAPAQAYCSNLVPRLPTPQEAAVTLTTTITRCHSDPTAKTKRKRDDNEGNDDSASEGERGDNNLSTHDDIQAKAFAKLRHSKKASCDVCNCLVAITTTTPSTSTSNATHTIYITTSCPSTHHCSVPTGTCHPTRNCNSPARCSPQSYCLESATGASFCHPDTDDPSQGYCMSAGPAGQGCPETYEDCATNSECAGSRVRIYACCREEPFCVDVDDYRPGDMMGYGTFISTSEGLWRRRRRMGRYGVGAERELGVNPTWR